jgi:hypothetical protein
LNVQLSSALLEAGIGVTKANDFFANAGVVSPTPRNARDDHDRLLAVAANMAEEQLRENRRKHVRVARGNAMYKGDIKFVFGGTPRSVARGPISMDGAGAKRAYQHWITGDQHMFVICSAITREPIYVKVDQTCCQKCNQKVTEYLRRTGKKTVDVADGDMDFTHDGACHRNSKYGPAVAEEHAAMEAGKVLLELPDDEAIF